MLKIGTKKNGLTHSVVPPINAEWNCVRTKTERYDAPVHRKATVTGSPSTQTCSLSNRYRQVGRNTNPHGQLIQLQINLREWWLWARGLSPRSTREACFFSLLNPQVSSSRQRTIDWKGLDDEPRMVLYKHRNRPDHDCIYYFNLRRAQKANLVFHQSCSDAIVLCDNASKRTGQGCHFCRRNFCSKGNPRLQSSQRRLTLREQIDLRIPGRPEMPRTADEKADKHFLFPSLTKTSHKFSCHFMNQRFMLRKTATRNDMKMSKIVCNAENA